MESVQVEREILSEVIGVAGIEKIKAHAELDHGPEDGRFLDGGARVLCGILGPFKSARGTVLPEINA